MYRGHLLKTTTKKCFLEACGAILLNIRFAWELLRILVKD